MTTPTYETLLKAEEGRCAAALVDAVVAGDADAAAKIARDAEELPVRTAVGHLAALRDELAEAEADADRLNAEHRKRREPVMRLSAELDAKRDERRNASIGGASYNDVLCQMDREIGILQRAHRSARRVADDIPPGNEASAANERVARLRQAIKEATVRVFAVAHVAMPINAESIEAKRRPPVVEPKRPGRRPSLAHLPAKRIG